MHNRDELERGLDELQKKSDKLSRRSTTDLIGELRNAQPSWQKDGYGLQGPEAKATPAGVPQSVSPLGRFPLKVEQTASQPPFPETTAEEVTNATEESATNSNEYSFELEVDSIDQDAYTVDVHIGYGEINDTPPDGMTGADDYILTIPGADSGTEIYAVITYDIDTLDITSRTLAFGATVPDSVLGTIYWPIGFVDINYSGIGAIAEVNPHNRHCGDINFALLYVSLNGQPALFVGCGQPPIALPDALVT